MTLQLINAQPRDIPAINELLRASKGYWKDYDEDFLDRYMAIYQIDEAYLQKNQIKLVYHDNKLIGFYCFVLHNEDTLELDHFFLHPDYIGKGFGNQMWEACCQTASEYGQQEFILWSEVHTEEFYRKKGCVKIGTRPSPLQPNRHPSIYKCRLNQPAKKI